MRIRLRNRLRKEVGVNVVKLVFAVIIAIALLSLVFSLIGWIAYTLTVIVEIVVVIGLGYLIWYAVSHR